MLTMVETGPAIPDLCQLIRAEREKAGLSQEELARKLDMSLAGYRLYERFREPKPPRLRQIALALRLPEDYFMRGGLDTETIEERVAELADKIEALDGWLKERLADK